MSEALRRSRAAKAVAVLVLALAFYTALIGYRAVDLLTDPRVGLKVLGVAVLVVPLVGIWLVIAEIRFGIATQRLGERLDAEGAEPEPELPRTAAGRVDRAAADEFFEQRSDELKAAPLDWRTWYRLALAYDLAGDRRRARETMRTAVAIAQGSGMDSAQ